ncbi:hypothetical protein [Kangiella sp. TOML190]|uniref:hypothetical protein n=1 Tax=Kangiella sp. TOML190 TaxID=2931351 RepID=UPI00203B89D5|nr:hypothetical protein [Kangiella sp. TOML190]
MNDKSSFKEQLSHHSLSIISLLVAIVALTYNTWRTDTTETNRNLRTASFELIRELGKLQNTTNQLHYAQSQNAALTQEQFIQGWGHVALIEDLSALLPQDIESQALDLKTQWQTHHQQLGQQQNAETQISLAISNTRQKVRALLHSLE